MILTAKDDYGLFSSATAIRSSRVMKWLMRNTHRNKTVANQIIKIAIKSSICFFHWSVGEVGDCEARRGAIS